MEMAVSWAVAIKEIAMAGRGNNNVYFPYYPILPSFALLYRHNTRAYGVAYSEVARPIPSDQVRVEPSKWNFTHLSLGKQLRPLDKNRSQNCWKMASVTTIKTYVKPD